MMTLTHHTSPSWAALPNLRQVSWTEGLRLALIVGSLSLTVLAGQFAQTRNHELSMDAANRIASATYVTARPTTSHATANVYHRKTPAERFARSQIKTFSELLDNLTERAEILIAVSPVSSADSAQLKSSLQALDEDLMEARQALLTLERANAPTSSKEAVFLEEDLRSSLIGLQAGAARAQRGVISLDQLAEPVQGFKVSRIGQ